MTDAVINDITSKTMPKDQSYRVQIQDRGHNISKDIDVGYDEVKDLLASVKHIDWYTLTKNKETGRWDKIPFTPVPTGQEQL